MQIKALIGFTTADLSLALGVGDIATVDDLVGEALIADGIAEEYVPPVVPTGKKTITTNGTDIDVAEYATADVAVPASAVVSGTKNITANGTNIDVTEYAAVDVAVPATAYVTYTFDSTTKLVTGMALHGFTGSEPELDATSNGYIFKPHKATLATVDFSDCPAMQTIQQGAFDGYTALANVVFPPNCTTIQRQAFRNCSSLAITEIPSSVQNIGESAFHACTSIVSLLFHEGTNVNGATVFKNCTGLKNVEVRSATFGSTLYSLYFDGCSGLEKVWLRDTVSRINASTAAKAPFAGASDTVAIYAEAAAAGENWGEYYNRTGASGAIEVSVTFNQSTAPWAA